MSEEEKKAYQKKYQKEYYRKHKQYKSVEYIVGESNEDS